MEEARPWAGLPEDLLDRIFAHLPSFSDRACCSGVCKYWRSRAMQREHAAPGMLPWVLRPSTAGASYFRLFSRTTTEEPAVPENARGARFIGSLPGGWFFVARGQWRGYALLNLLTGDEVPLPDGLRRDQIPDELKVGIDPSALMILAATVSPALTPDGLYVVAALTLGHHKLVCWRPGMDCWMAMDPQEVPNSNWWSGIMLEGLEDVIYCSCYERKGFYLLTSQERLLVFRINFGDLVPVFGDLTFYEFLDHRMTSPPEIGQNVARRYLVTSGESLLMVKRFTSPERGTVSFQVFRLRWRNSEPYWHRTSLIGELLFISRGCSRSFLTGRLRPGYIYFLDDAEVFHDSWSIVRTEKQYRCSDAGWCSYSTQYVQKSWPEGPRPNSSPWIWRFH